jgi:hypothetical protein
MTFDLSKLTNENGRVVSANLVSPITGNEFKIDRKTLQDIESSSMLRIHTPVNKEDGESTNEQ